MVASLRTVEWMLDLSSNAFSITYLILWVAVFTRQICLPVPANLSIDRRSPPSWWRVEHECRICVGILGCLARDLLWFEAGRPMEQPDHADTLRFCSDPHYCAQ